MELSVKQNLRMVFGIFPTALCFAIPITIYCIYNSVKPPLILVFALCILPTLIWDPIVRNKYVNKKKSWIRKAREVYEQGEEVPIKFHSVEAGNLVINKINRQRVIAIQIEGQYLRIKNFSDKVVKAYAEPPKRMA